MTLGTILSLILTGLAVLAIVIGLLIGLKRRTYRALLRLASYILAAVIALFITLPISSLICGSVWPMLQGMLPLADFNALLESSIVLQDLLTVLPAILVAILLYMFVFAILSLLMLIPYCIIARKVVSKDVKSSFKGDRLVGMAVGAVSGLLVLAIALAPLASVIRFGSTLTTSLPNEDSSMDSVNEVMEGISGN